MALDSENYQAYFVNLNFLASGLQIHVEYNCGKLL